LPDEVLLHYPSETGKASMNLLGRTFAALSGHDQLPPEWTYLNIRCGGFLSN